MAIEYKTLLQGFCCAREPQVFPPPLSPVRHGFISLTEREFVDDVAESSDR